MASVRMKRPKKRWGVGCYLNPPDQINTRRATSKGRAPLNVAQVLAVLATLACQPDQVPVTAPTTPQRQFVLEDFDLQERHAGNVIWQGHAAYGDGDLEHSQVKRLVLTRCPQTQDERTVTLHAEQADLALAAGRADFVPVCVQDGADGVLRGSRAHYDGQARTLTAEGPITFETPTGTLSASRAQMHLGDGTLMLQGPVVGRLLPPVRATGNAH
jgi:hypothetical protein